MDEQTVDKLNFAAWAREVGDFDHAHAVLSEVYSVEPAVARAYDREVGRATYPALRQMLERKDIPLTRRLPDGTVEHTLTWRYTMNEMVTQYERTRMLLEAFAKEKAETTLAPRWIQSRELGLKVYPFFRF